MFDVKQMIEEAEASREAHRARGLVLSQAYVAGYVTSQLNLAMAELGYDFSIDITIGDELCEEN